MPYLVIEDFKSGLDTRKSAYTAPPGSLRTFENGHVTRGGEVEKRKALVEFATLPAGTFGLHSVRDELHVFGSGATPPGMPANITYQRLKHTDGSTDLSVVLDADNFNGKIYAVAEYTDGAVYHFYDGTRVTDWDTISATISDNGDVAQVLADKITAGTDFGVVVAGATLTVTAPVAGTGFTYSAEAVNGGSINDQTLTATETQANRAAVAEVLAEGSFRVTGGTASTGVNTVTSVTVDGVEVLGTAVDWATSNSATAQAIAGQINAHSSAVEYTASADGNRVVLTALAGTGAGPNGFVVTATPAGDVEISEVTNMHGGVTAVTAQAQVVEFTVGGTFELDDQFRITLDGDNFVVRAGAAGTARAIMTFDDKVYAVTLSSVYFTGFKGTPPLPDPTAWNGATGSGFINISTQTGGSDNLTALGIYQEFLVIFAARAAQIWGVDPDPDLNQKIQLLQNIGTSAHRSVVSFGDIDVFFLSDFGVRSLRARDSSNLASAQDVGTPIDGEITEFLLSVPDNVRNRAVSAVDPLSGRYLLAIGSRIYVFSHYPGSKIAAWSTYQLDEDVTDMAVANNRVFVRAGDTIYVYGGNSGTEYDTTAVEVELPFLDFGTPATEKTLHSIDIGCEGTWEIWLRQDPQHPELEERLGEITNGTYGLQGRFPIERQSTHFSLRLRSTNDGYARIGNIALHYSASQSG